MRNFPMPEQRQSATILGPKPIMAAEVNCRKQSGADSAVVFDQIPTTAAELDCSMSPAGDNSITEPTPTDYTEASACLASAVDDITMDTFSTGTTGKRCLRSRTERIVILGQKSSSSKPRRRRALKKMTKGQIKNYQQPSFFQQGGLAFAALRGFRPWPCRIQSVTAQYTVQFFATNDIATVPISRMYRFCDGTIEAFGARSDSNRKLAIQFNDAMAIVGAVQS